MKIIYVANVRFSSDKAHAIQFFKMADALSSCADLVFVLPRKGVMVDLATQYGLKNKLTIMRIPVIDTMSSTRFGFTLAAITFAIGTLVYLAAEKLKRHSFVLYTIDLDQLSFLLLPIIAPVFIEIHGSKRKNIFTTFFFKRVRGIVAVSGAIAGRLKSVFGIDDSRVIIAPNGIDLAFFERGQSVADAKQKLGISSKQFF